jgi:hypothetical protein
MVVQYANYFGLEGVERFDFFIEALSSAKQITVDVEKIKGVDKKVFIRFLAGILAFERPNFSSAALESKVFDIENLIKEVFPKAFL